jgi:TM2 domain-containing membrane protein YozV
MTNYSKESEYSDRSWLVTFILCIFGFTGLHRLYTGHVVLALLYSLTGGFLLIGVIHDLITLLFGSYRDVSGKRLK